MATKTKSRSTTNRIKKKPVAKIDDNGHSLRGVLAGLSELVTRSGMAAYLGKSYGGDRDLYTALGYKTTLDYKDYLARYQRQDIASAIIEAPVKASWRYQPMITETDEEETAFEKDWAALSEKLQAYHYFSRLDIVTGIGRYGVLLIGFNDGVDLSLPVRRASDVLYLMPYSESSAKITSFVTDESDRRYALPEMYRINITTGSDTGAKSMNVHWTRVIHVAENATENDVYGTPRLKKVFNRLEDLERIVGGSAEMFWRGAFPGFGLPIQADASVSDQTLSQLQDEMEKYLHGFQRYLRLQGVDIKELKAQVADPSNHVSVIVDMISAATRIPKRILLGSERGELASSQDERNWMQQIDERRHNLCEAKIIRPFIDRLIEFGVLSKPTEHYTVEWPDLLTPSDKDKAEVGEIRAKALKNYVEAVGAETIVPSEIFLKKFLNLTNEDIEQIDNILDEMNKQANQDQD